MQLRSLNTAVLTALAIVTTLGVHARAQNSAEQPDKYQWLEDVSGERSMAWVKAENARSAKVLQADPRFAVLCRNRAQGPRIPHRLALPDLRRRRDLQHLAGRAARPRHPAQDLAGQLPHRRTPLADRHRLRRARQRTTKSGFRKASTASIPATASAWSPSPPAAKTPTPSASSISRPASSSKTASSCRDPSRTSPGSTRTPCWSPATGVPAP